MHVARALLLAAAAVAPASRAAAVNVISRVEVTDAGPALVLTIHGSQRPSFTTFAVEDPPRFVIEVANGELRGVAPELARDSGPIAAVRAEQVSGRPIRTARLTLSFRGELGDAQVSTEGNALRVAVPKAVGVIAVAPIELAAAAPVRAEPLDDARDRLRAAPQTQPTQSEVEAPPTATPTPTATVLSVRAERSAAPQIQPTQSEVEAPPTATPTPTSTVLSVRAERSAAPQIQPTQSEVEAPPTPTPTATTWIREVGFRQLPDASRVYVRTAGPPVFSVEEPRERVVRLRFDGARTVRPNDARPLDTSFFPSAVARVTPRRDGATFILDIALRDRVTWQQRVEGDLLAIDFALPAAARPGP